MSTSSPAERMIALPEEARVYADGASRGNPGPAAAGWVICDANDTPVLRGHRALGRRTNNEAEYAAATLGLETALLHGVRRVLLRADSELLVRQVLGQYQVRNARLRPLYDALMAVTRKFERFAVEHVRRALNAEADAEANAALDALRPS